MGKYNFLRFKFFVFAIFFLFAFNSFGQKTIPNSFTIINNSSKYSVEFISESILKANFEIYRSKEAKIQLAISNGFTIELISAKELFILNNSIEVEKYSSVNTSQNINLELLDNGFFIQKVNSVSNPKKKSLAK